jgi:nicotinamide-nucleotide amidase
MQRAKRAKMTLVTAESCTAGQLVSLLAAQPTAADVLKGGYVVYSKASKAAMLGLSPRLLQRHTAVSSEVASEMATGALRRSGSDIALAITGVAGPSSDEDGNPVGLAFIAVARRARKVICIRRQLGSKRPQRNLLGMHQLALKILATVIEPRGRPSR